MVDRTSINTSCKKEIFWISKTIKKNKFIFIKNGVTQLLNLFLSSLVPIYIPSRIPLEFIASMNLKWCIGHKLIHPTRKKSFVLVKPSKKQIHIQQKWCDPATELISNFLSLYFYSNMNSFGIHCFNELKMVYWT
jgi:hypothetical protein